MKKEIEKNLKEAKKELEILVSKFNSLNKESQALAQQVLKQQGAVDALDKLVRDI